MVIRCVWIVSSCNNVTASSHRCEFQLLTLLLALSLCFLQASDFYYLTTCCPPPPLACRWLTALRFTDSTEHTLILQRERARQGETLSRPTAHTVPLLHPQHTSKHASYLMNTNPAYLLFHRWDGASAEAKVLITCFGAPLSHLLSLLCLSLQVLDAPSAICHYLDDNSCSALIILGFVMMSPLVIVAAAVFCGLLRKFRLLLFIQPIKRAWYRGRLLDWAGSIHAWVWSQQRRWCWGSQWSERLICARRTWGLQMFCKNSNIIIVNKTVIQLILTLSMVVKMFDILEIFESSFLLLVLVRKSISPSCLCGDIEAAKTR